MMNSQVAAIAAERDEALAEVERLRQQRDDARVVAQDWKELHASAHREWRDVAAEVDRLTRLNERARHNAREQKAKADRYREALEELRYDHHRPDRNYHDHAVAWCLDDGYSWPCATARIVREALDGEWVLRGEFERRDGTRTDTYRGDALAEVERLRKENERLCEQTYHKGDVDYVGCLTPKVVQASYMDMPEPRACGECLLCVTFAERDGLREALTEVRDYLAVHKTHGNAEYDPHAWHVHSIVTAALDGGGDVDLNNPGPRGYEKMRKPRDGGDRTCNCGNCDDTTHASDCAVHNEPAYPAGPCDEALGGDRKGSTVSGAERIAAERQRQVEEEGWTPEHDAKHGEGTLVAAASCYASVARQQLRDEGWNGVTYPRAIWPWDQRWWKPSDDPVRNLEKAGALIAAEIDRLTHGAEA